MNLTYVVFDLAVALIAVRSLAVLRLRAPVTSIGWVATTGYFCAAAWRYAHDDPQPEAMLFAQFSFWMLAAAFIVGVIRDEPQAEPLVWPSRVGLTRAEKKSR